LKSSADSYNRYNYKCFCELEGELKQAIAFNGKCIWHRSRKIQKHYCDQTLDIVGQRLAGYLISRRVWHHLGRDKASERCNIVRLDSFLWWLVTF
jgi:hypothetical protein